MRRFANKARSQLADEVLKYLIRHKRASDTVEGIVAWWLPMQEIRYAIEEVEAVLEELVADGLITARTSPDGGIHYRIDPTADQAIRRRLEMKPSQSHPKAAEPSKSNVNKVTGDR